MIAHHGLEARFVLHPASRDTASLYRDATCAVIPSDIEPFSMVAIEAAAHARPVIATRSGGPDDIVLDGETGLLIDIGNVDSLADAMLTIIRDIAKAARMGEAARAHFQTEYAPDAVIPRYEALIDAAHDTPLGERRRLAQVAARYFMSRHEP
jgi:glycosyltransferase involved in cell wall biosynthesis